MIIILTSPSIFFFFFFNDPAPPEIYPLSLHAALPIPHPAVPGASGHPRRRQALRRAAPIRHGGPRAGRRHQDPVPVRSEEHTSELQSQSNLVCRLLLEKKKSKAIKITSHSRYSRRAIA